MYGVQVDVQFGTRDHGLDRTALIDLICKTHSRVIEHPCRPVEQSKQGPSHLVVFLSRVVDAIWLVFACPHIDLLAARVKTNLSLCVSSSGSLAMEARCFSASLEWSHYLCFSFPCSCKTGFFREWCFQQISPWSWWLLSGLSQWLYHVGNTAACSLWPQGEWLAVLLALWWKNLLSFSCCGIFWPSRMSGSFTKVWSCSDFTCGSCQVTRPQGWLFKIGCRGCHLGPQKIHSMLAPGKVV